MKFFIKRGISCSIVLHLSLMFSLLFQSVVNGPGLGVGTINAHGASGAGHGGFGGKGYLQDIRGTFYNSLLQPNMYGSAGGGSTTHGGGILRVICNTLKVDGEIRANGQSGVNVNGLFNGGASGGSIWLTSREVDGSGVISANGGNGDSLSGGGSGGRIAIHYSTRSKFEGTLTAYGGDSSHETGAAGTSVFVNSITGETNLTVTNRGRKPTSNRITDMTRLSIDAARTWVPLNEAVSKQSYTSHVIGANSMDYKIEYGFNVLTLGGSAHLAFEHSRLAYTSVFIAQQFIGTYEGKSFGYIHAAARQLIVIVKSDFYVPTNLQIYQGGVVQLPAKVMLHKNNLNLEGSLCGIRELSVSAGTLSIASTSKVGYFLSSTAGFDLSKLSVFASASIVVSTVSFSPYKIKATTLDVLAGKGIEFLSVML